MKKLFILFIILAVAALRLTMSAHAQATYCDVPGAPVQPVAPVAGGGEGEGEGELPPFIIPTEPLGPPVFSSNNPLAQAPQSATNAVLTTAVYNPPAGGLSPFFSVTLGSFSTGTIITGTNMAIPSPTAVNNVNIQMGNVVVTANVDGGALYAVYANSKGAISYDDYKAAVAASANHAPLPASFTSVAPPMSGPALVAAYNSKSIDYPQALVSMHGKMVQMIEAEKAKADAKVQVGVAAMNDIKTAAAKGDATKVAQLTAIATAALNDAAKAGAITSGQAKDMISSAGNTLVSVVTTSELASGSTPAAAAAEAAAALTTATGSGITAQTVAAIVDAVTTAAVNAGATLSDAAFQAAAASVAAVTGSSTLTAEQTATVAAIAAEVAVAGGNPFEVAMEVAAAVAEATADSGGAPSGGGGVDVGVDSGVDAGGDVSGGGGVDAGVDSGVDAGGYDDWW